MLMLFSIPWAEKLDPKKKKGTIHILRKYLQEGERGIKKMAIFAYFQL